ncbi:MAG: glycosyl transferase group 1 [Deltaproteobacteria bacterium]|nr:glycosyl transferase group 1 [Deltaproteobacteria bacterium]
MRVALLTPYYLHSTRGNAVTVRRIEQQLQQLGCTAAVFSLDAGSAESLARQVRSFAPHIVHAFHAVRCGEPARLLAAENRIPYVITMTGTDMYCSGEGGAAGLRLDLLDGAAALVFFAAEVRQSFLAAHPELAVATAVIPQGVALPGTLCAEPPAAAAFNFLLPAGIRAVKNLLMPFAPLAELQRRYPQTRLVLAGGVIEAEYAGQLFAAVAANPFARWEGEVAFEKMPGLYNSAHVVLNSSLSEGGMANSLLEGMAYGRALLAADVEGNRSLVRDGENGLLFSDAADFLGKAEMLLLDQGLRHRLAAAGRDYVRRNCSPALEAGRYLEIYSACC